MRFFQMLASSAAFIAAALALEINDYPAGGVQAGKTYTITYSPADKTPTTFILRKGLSTDLDTVGTLTSMFRRHSCYQMSRANKYYSYCYWRYLLLDCGQQPCQRW